MQCAAPKISLSQSHATLRAGLTGSDGERLGSVRDRLVEAACPDKIILFGSRARGDCDLDSDFDLFVLVPETRPFGEKEAFWLWH